MSHNYFKPDISTSTGYPGGQQHSSASPSVIDMDINALLLRVDSLEQTLQHLQGKFLKLQSLLSTSDTQPQSRRTYVAPNCHVSTQTEPASNFAVPMDPETLTHKIRQCQSDDRDIFMLKYLLEQDIKPKADEISNFHPRMRRYLWQFPVSS